MSKESKRPAILMHLTAIAEQFNKLKQTHADDILSGFDDRDIKGMYDVRTYIAHDYEGVNLAIVEWIIRNGLPKFKEQCTLIIKNPPLLRMTLKRATKRGAHPATPLRDIFCNTILA